MRRGGHRHAPAPHAQPPLAHPRPQNGVVKAGVSEPAMRKAAARLGTLEGLVRPYCGPGWLLHMVRNTQAAEQMSAAHAGLAATLKVRLREWAGSTGAGCWCAALPASMHAWGAA